MLAHDHGVNSCVQNVSHFRELQCASLQKFSPKIQAAATFFREWAAMATLNAAVDHCHFQDSAAKRVQMKATNGWQQMLL